MATAAIKKATRLATAKRIQGKSLNQLPTSDTALVVIKLLIQDLQKKKDEIEEYHRGNVEHSLDRNSNGQVTVEDKKKSIQEYLEPITRTEEWIQYIR